MQGSASSSTGACLVLVVLGLFTHVTAFWPAAISFRPDAKGQVLCPVSSQLVVGSLVY